MQLVLKRTEETEDEIIKKADTLNKVQNAMTIFFTSYIAMSEKSQR